MLVGRARSLAAQASARLPLPAKRGRTLGSRGHRSQMLGFSSAATQSLTTVLGAPPRCDTPSNAARCASLPPAQTWPITRQTRPTAPTLTLRPSLNPSPHCRLSIPTYVGALSSRCHPSGRTTTAHRQPGSKMASANLSWIV